MNEKKFCFISCVNNSQYYEECLYYIERLNVPTGYEIEVLSIEDSKSMASGYNEAMNASDAKYKIYLHQDTFIINENFLYDILYTFENNSDIGMIGVVGSKVIPTSAIWWETNHKYGKVYESSAGNLSELKFKDVEKRYEQVKIIDGLIMITQYDLPWRDDVFDGYHFYDASQSTEFIKKGYKVIVPNQDKPWIIHDCGMAGIGDYEKYRQKFIDEYYKDIFPLVSILIPTYNRPKYFKLALESAINQTYKNIEIVVGDDGTDNKTEKLIEDYLNKYDNIRYYHNKSNLGQFDNDLKLMDKSKGRYVNFLMDDDLFEKDKIEKMINVFIEDDKNEISLVSSNRKLIDGEGIFKTNYILDETISTVCDKVWNGKEITELILSQNKNIIGEPTTVLFDKTKMTEKFGYYDNRRFICNVDQATWFNLLKGGKCIILSEILSSFRMHNNQQLINKNNIIGGVEDYCYLIFNARTNGLFSDDILYSKSIKTCHDYCECVYRKFGYNNIVKKYTLKLEILLKKLNEKLPLVSILIPAYNQTKYLNEALESAVNQTYPNIEIIIGDDSTNNEVRMLVNEYINKYSNITYIKNSRSKMDYGSSNICNLFKISKGEYVNYLFHDDKFRVDKIEKMMRYLLNNPDVSLVTSIRQVIDEEGNTIEPYGGFIPICNKDTYFTANQIRKFVVKNNINVIGEPTCGLYKKEFIDGGKIMCFNGKKFFNISDVADWFTVLNHGNMIYIAEPLSYFRVHGEQNSTKLYVILRGLVDWHNLCIESYKTKILNRQEYYESIKTWFTINSDYINRVKKEKYEILPEDKELIKELLEKIENTENMFCN